MNTDTASACLAELGNPRRLEAFRLAVRAGPDGLTVGEIQRHLGIPKSTLSHHCLHLCSAGLLTQRRVGRTIRCVANFDLARELAGFLVEECCRGVEMVERAATNEGEDADDDCCAGALAACCGPAAEACCPDGAAADCCPEPAAAGA